MNKRRSVQFSIVIPMYNEEKNVLNLIQEIIDNLINFKNLYEIIVVDDGSTDKTLFFLEEIKSKYKEIIRIKRNKINQGQSFSLRKGILEASYNTIVTIDGDCQNNPADILKLIDMYFLEKKYHLIGGIRTKRKDSYIKKISSKIANNVRKLYLRDNCIDTGCSLKVFDKEVFKLFPFFDGIHRFLPALFSGYGKKTFFLPVDHRPRVYGYSKYKTLGRLYQGIFDMIRVKKIIKKQSKNDL